jgi:hypothetical protein
MTPAHTACARPPRILHAHAPPHTHAEVTRSSLLRPSHRSRQRASRSRAHCAPPHLNRAASCAQPQRALCTRVASTRRKRNRCDYKFLRNTLTSDINTAREADRRSASRAPMTVIPLQNCSVTVQQVARIAAASASVAVAKRRHSSSAQLHSNVKFGAVARGEDGGTCPPESHRLSRHPESTTQRGLV